MGPLGFCVLVLHVVVNALAQESGVFAFGPSREGVLIQVDVDKGNVTVLSDQKANNSLVATEAARIHPTFKYWYQVFVDPSSWAPVSVEGRDIFPGAVVTSSTQLPHPSECASGANTDWNLFDLQCGGRPVFVLGTVLKQQLFFALIELNGTKKCLSPFTLSDSLPSPLWLQSALDLDSIIYLTLNSSVVVLDISKIKPEVVAETKFPQPMLLTRLHYFFRLNALYGFYSVNGRVGICAFNSTTFQFKLFPLLSVCSLPTSPLLSALDTDNDLLIGVLECNSKLAYVGVNVSSGSIVSNVPVSQSVVSLNALANVF